jgi:hypothetical protein
VTDELTRAVVTAFAHAAAVIVVLPAALMVAIVRPAFPAIHVVAGAIAAFVTARAKPIAIIIAVAILVAIAFVIALIVVVAAMEPARRGVAHAVEPTAIVVVIIPIDAHLFITSTEPIIVTPVARANIAHVLARLNPAEIAVLLHPASAILAAGVDISIVSSGHCDPPNRT